MGPEFQKVYKVISTHSDGKLSLYVLLSFISWISCSGTSKICLCEQRNLANWSAEFGKICCRKLVPTYLQGCVRGQHSRGQGQRSSRPRPGVFKAKATKFCPRGVLEVGQGQSSRTPIPGLFTAQCYAESGYATSSVCPSLKFNAILPPLVLVY